MARRGSEKRTRTAMIAIRLLPDEHEKVKRLAQERGVTVTELIKMGINHIGAQGTFNLGYPRIRP